jgi:hypothetical protein
MLDPQQLDSLIRVVSAMDRDDVTRRLLRFRASFNVDFTPDYLRGLSLDRMRHLLVAACLQAGQLPGVPMADAA